MHGLHTAFQGTLGSDPELRYTPQGVAVCDFALAVNRKFTKKDGEKVDEVAFVDVTAWARLAEICAEFLLKGRPLLVSGRLSQDRWEDEATGQKRSKHKLTVDVMQMLDTRGAGEGGEGGRPMARAAAPASRPAAYNPGDEEPAGGSDAEIPF